AKTAHGARLIPSFRAWVWLLLWAMLMCEVEPSQRTARVGSPSCDLDLQTGKQHAGSASARSGERPPLAELDPHAVSADSFAASPPTAPEPLRRITPATAKLGSSSSPPSSHKNKVDLDNDNN
ncbi:unnamed protein product, partial [Laminaria digitata]